VGSLGGAGREGNPGRAPGPSRPWGPSSAPGLGRGLVTAPGVRGGREAVAFPRGRSLVASIRTPGGVKRAGGRLQRGGLVLWLLRALVQAGSYILGVNWSCGTLLTTQAQRWLSREPAFSPEVRPAVTTTAAVECGSFPSFASRGEKRQRGLSP